MTRHLPNIVLIALCVLVWILWQQRVYPFSEPLFTHDGYGAHLFGGIGYTAFQVSVTYLSAPEAAFSPRFFVIQGLAATGLLGVLELMQYGDPYRHVQIEDLFVQTIGVLVALTLLSFLERKRLTRRKP